MVEALIKLILAEMGFSLPKISEVWSASELRAFAQAKSAIHWQRCCRGAARNGIDLNTASAQLVADAVFKIDQLLKVPHLWGLQITISAADCEKKLNQLERVAPNVKMLGVQKLVLLEVVPPQKSWEGHCFLTKEQKEQIEELLFDALELAEESEEFVVQTQLNLGWLC